MAAQRVVVCQGRINVWYIFIYFSQRFALSLARCLPLEWKHTKSGATCKTQRNANVQKVRYMYNSARRIRRAHREPRGQRMKRERWR